MTLTDADYRAAFDTAETVFFKAGQALQAVAHRLPDFFDPTTHGDRECAHSALKVVEPGYTRYENASEWDDDARTMHGRTRGYDAYGEHGIVEYLECPTWDGGCGLTWRMPDNFDWD